MSPSSFLASATDCSAVPGTSNTRKIIKACGGSACAVIAAARSPRRRGGYLAKGSHVYNSHMYGAVYLCDAVDAVCRLSGIERPILEEIVWPQQGKLKPTKEIV